MQNRVSKKSATAPEKKKEICPIPGAKLSLFPKKEFMPSKHEWPKRQTQIPSTHEGKKQAPHTKTKVRFEEIKKGRTKKIFLGEHRGYLPKPCHHALKKTRKKRTKDLKVKLSKKNEPRCGGRLPPRATPYSQRK